MTRINTNVPSLFARANLERTNKELELRLQRLSTGLRLNRGADDPAGLIISERIRSDLRGIEQGIKNSNRASSVIATTEGALTEDSATRPLNAYGADKLGGEFHAAVAMRLHGVRTAALRFFNVYGPGQDPNSPYSGVISIFAQRIMAGEPVVIHGDGKQSRDFVYVGDVVHFLVAAMAAASTRPLILNVCSGRAPSVRALFDVLCDVCGRQVPVTQGPARAGDMRRSLGDPRLARDTLGVAASTTLHEGLTTTFGNPMLVVGARA